MLIAGEENEILKQTQNNKSQLSILLIRVCYPFPYQIPELNKV